MKIILTFEEVKRMVADKMNLDPSKFTMEVVSGNLDMADKILGDFQRQGFLKCGDIDPAQKIPAIKHLRTLINGLGLAEAKFHVENFPAFINKMKTLPFKGCDSQGHIIWGF